MAGAIVQSAYNVDDSGGNGLTIAATLNGVVAGNHIVAHVGWTDSTRTCTVSDGTSYSTGDPARSGVDNQPGQVFYKENSSGGNFTITATFSVTTPFRRIRVCEVSGLQTSSSLDKNIGQAQTTPGTGGDQVTSSATAATTNANDFLMGFSQDTSESDPGTGTLTAGTNYTISGSNIIMGLESRSVTATGAYEATFTQSVNNSRITHIVIFKESGASAGNLMWIKA